MEPSLVLREGMGRFSGRGAGWPVLWDALRGAVLPARLADEGGEGRSLALPEEGGPRGLGSFLKEI